MNCAICDKKISSLLCRTIFIDEKSYDVCSDCEKKWQEIKSKNLSYNAFSSEVKNVQTELNLKIQDKISEEEEKTQLCREINDIYEYKTYVLYDSKDGSTDEKLLSEVLNNFAKDGWHLVSMTNNELGKNSFIINNIIANLGLGSNATIDQTVLVFERCVKRYK